MNINRIKADIKTAESTEKSDKEKQKTSEITIQMFFCIYF